MPAQITFLDQSVSLTPPGGYLEPQPILLGPTWQPNDVRLFFISGAGQDDQNITSMLRMAPDPPTGFSSAYSLNPGLETEGVYYNRLAPGDTDTSVAWTKPPNWGHFILATLTARGVNPASTPTAGRLTVKYTVGDPSVTISSVAVPSAGTMMFCLGTVPDPEGNWPSWAVSMGVPTGWTPLVSTDKSGVTYFPYDTNPGLMVIAKSFAGSGSTGSVAVPVSPGGPAFAALYAFLPPAPDVTVTVGAA